MEYSSKCADDSRGRQKTAKKLVKRMYGTERVDVREAHKVTDLSFKLREIALRSGVEEVYAFGSRAKEMAASLHGENVSASYPRSDVDITNSIF